MKKENYNLDFDLISAEINNYIKSFTKRTKKSFELSETALLVLDMQNYFLNEESHAFIPAVNSIISNTNNIIDLFYSQNCSIFYTQHYNDKNSDSMMNKWWRDGIEINSENYMISNSIKVLNENIISKAEYDAFYNTQLIEKLKNKNIKSLVIVGVMTNLCVETTARAAFVNGFEVIIISDATAAYNLELHKASLLSMCHGIAYIDNTNDLLSKVRQSYA